MVLLRRDVSSTKTIFTRRRQFGIVPLGICFLVVGILWTPAFRTAAANGPAPPQLQQDSGAVTVQVDSGQSLFVDPLWNDGGKGQCRVVANKTSLPLAVPLGSRSEWQSFRDPLPWPAGPHAGTTSPNHFLDSSAGQTVCCRPQSVTLCQGAPGGTVAMSLPYTAESDSRTLTATCVDQWNKTYTDSQTWQCGHSGSGAAADGAWSEVGGDSYVCSPNAFTSACSATCGGGGSTATGTQTTYDSCGKVQSVTSCTISCCTTNYQAATGACSGSCGGGSGTQTVTMTDFGSCHNASYSYIQNCVNNTSCMYYGFSSCTPVECLGPGNGYVCDCPYVVPNNGPPKFTIDTSDWTGWGWMGAVHTSIPSGCVPTGVETGVWNVSNSAKGQTSGAPCSPTSDRGGDANCWNVRTEYVCTE